MPLTSGTRLGPYEILSAISAGGMGEVYRARDSRLDRLVALKVLPDDKLANDERRRRFVQEARAASALNHPNIVTIYDVGCDHGVDYLAMELVSGRTLDELTPRDGLPIALALRYAVQAADALAKAHAAGIIHRDLKPGNMMVTDEGLVKILDFGLAKLVHANTGRIAAVTATQTRAPNTEDGHIVGTVSYMSPEQAEGRTVDVRSDVFSFGAVLYEIVTGKRAFHRDSTVSTLTAILRDEPPSVAEVRAETPTELVRIIKRCLRKDPGRRFQTVADLKVALEELKEESDSGTLTDVRPAAGPDRSSSVGAGATDSSAGRSIRSLVVLPFENRSGDPAQEFFSDGMTDALITDLAQIAALRVISRTSAMRFKGTHPRLSEIARELHVDGVVEGSALRVGDRVRITVQLVDIANDQNVWAKSYERSLTDILALQSEVAHAIASEIRIQVTPDERARLQSKKAVNSAAHVAYLQGLFLWNRFTSESVQEAIARYEEALAFDPNYAVAYAGLADSYIMLANHHILPPREGYSLARKAAEQGLALDESLGELHTSLGWIHRLFDWDWPAAERECLRSLQLNPGYAFGRSRYALLLSGVGRHEEAVAEAQRAHELDPLNLVTHTVVGDTLFYARRFDRSVAAYRKCLELDPTFGAAHTDLARSLEQVGQAAEAIEEFVRGTAGPDGRPPPSTGLAILYARAGRHDDARATMEAVAALAQKQFVSPYGIASYHAVTGDTGRALDWLEKAYAERDGTLVWLKVHPRLDTLRSESRFLDLLRRMRLDA